VHCVAGVGDVPAGTGVHVPTVPVRLHATQAAAQPVLQQTPCSQYPEPHSVAVVQVTPLTFLPQIVPLQTNPAAQSAVVAQLVLQSPVVPQMYGEQADSPPATQVPLPSQRPPDVSVPAEQVSAPQTVPEA
jgi:hypothetical protein